MDTINLSDIRPDLSFTGDLLIDSTFLLLPKTANISAAMITTVRKWGFENILCDGSLSLGGDIGITPVDDDQINDNKDLPKEKLKYGEKAKIRLWGADLSNQIKAGDWVKILGCTDTGLEDKKDPNTNKWYKNFTIVCTNGDVVMGEEPFKKDEKIQEQITEMQPIDDDILPF